MGVRSSSPSGTETRALSRSAGPPGLWLILLLVAAVETSAADSPPPTVPLPESGDLTALAHEPAIRRELALEPLEIATIDRVYTQLKEGRITDRVAGRELLAALRPGPRDRLYQIRRQVLDGGAILEGNVRVALNLTAVQHATLDQTRREAEAELAKLLASARFASKAAEQLYVARFYRKAYTHLPAELLTPEQRKQFVMLFGTVSEAVRPLIKRLEGDD